MPSSVEAELRALNEQYFHAVDQRDFAALGACFATDVVAIYLGGEWRMEGRAAVLERLEVIKSFDSCIHAPATMSFSVGGDGAGESATGVVLCVAHLLIDGQMVVRGLQYTDRYQLDPAGGGWQIAERRQDELFQYELPAVEPRHPVNR